jgi:hypothetical protein
MAAGSTPCVFWGGVPCIGTNFAAFIMRPHECKLMAAVAVVHALCGAEKESTFTLENHDDRAERR